MKADVDIVLIGANYKTCPLEVRERLATPGPALESASRAAAQVAGEAVILSTCHRVEVYAALRSPPGSPEKLVDLIAGWSGLSREELLAQSYICRGEEAVRHLFAVAGGLDSMVLGEFQVLGQVRDALQHALAWGTAGPILAALFQHAVSAGKRVRRETCLGRPDASLSRAAVELAQSILGDLKGQCALVIGAGKMGELAALALQEQGVEQIRLVSRTPGRAQELAARLGVAGTGFASLEQALAQCDLAISCTSAPHPVVQRSLVEQAMARRSSPLLLIDLAMPRDVEPQVGEIAGVSLYNVDAIRSLAGGPNPVTERELATARALLAEEVEGFEEWLRERAVIPLVASLYIQAEVIRGSELARASARLSDLSAEERQTLEALTRAIIKKLLHQPVMQLKRAARGGNGRVYREALRELFRLPENPGHGQRQPGNSPEVQPGSAGPATDILHHQ